MEGSFRLLACLVCIVPVGSFVRTKRDTTRSLLNTEVHSAPAQRWSMQVPAEASAAAGEAAVLPCTFTHPHRHYDGPLTAIWRSGEPYAGPQVFRCAAARGSELCQTALSLHGRFRLLGNPRRNDLSLRIERLALADDGRYFCRVEFAGDVHDRYESRHGIRLRVTGERGAGPGGGGEGRGGPRASVPPRLPRASERSLGRKGCNRHTPLSGAGGLTPGDGSKPPGNLLKMPNPGPRKGRRLEHPVTQDTPPRPQAQESNYENLSQMSPRGPRAATCSP
nr:sialic acid-binding Ig-like lectin 15 [Vicugna pacos]